MEVILKENIEKLGFKNEIVSVKNGYGRNYLIPKGLAILAANSAKKILEENLRQRNKKEETEINDANKAAEKLNKMEIILKAKVAEGGEKLFGSIKTSLFAEKTKELGQEIDTKFIKLPKIKELGNYEAEIRLHRNVTINIPFKVIAE